MDTIATKHLSWVRLVVAVTLALIGQVSRAGSNPVPFNQWTVNHGVIDTSTTCSTPGISCTVLAQDDGFLQQQVVTANGSYVQMILTNPGASGTADTLGFTTENFVPDKNLSGYDIANRQVIRDIPAGMEQIAQIDRAPFEDPDKGLVNLIHVDLTQTMSELNYDADFHLVRHEATLPAGEILSGKTIDMHQTSSTVDPYGVRELINTFSNKQSSGDRLSNVDGALLIDPFTPAAELQIDQQSYAIHAGDDIKLTGITQSLTSLPTAGAFELHNYENTTQALSATGSTIIDPFSTTP